MFIHIGGLAGCISEGACQNISIFMISDAPTIPLVLKLMDQMLGTFFLYQYIFATTVAYIHILFNTLEESKIISETT